MENKEDFEKSDIQRGSILNIRVDNLPRKLRDVHLNLAKGNFNIDDYSNWNVFQLNGMNPKKI